MEYLEHIKKLREPFDHKVYAIPYAGELFEEQAKKLINYIYEDLRRKIEKLPYHTDTMGFHLDLHSVLSLLELKDKQ